MPAFVPLIAAVIGAGATIYATEASRGRGAKPPAFGGSKKTEFETPDIFGAKSGGAGLLGGQGGQGTGLAQALGAGGGPPKFGPPAGPDFLKQQTELDWLKNLMKG